MKTTKPLIVLYDGGCPLCRRQAAFLKRRDKHARLRLSDIGTADMRTLDIAIPKNNLEKQIHAVSTDGAVLRGMDAVRAIWRAIGLGWIVAPTEWPLLRPVFNAFYAFVARNRQWLGGNPK